MHTLFGILLVLHGLITVAIASGSFAPAQNLPNPAWLRWWPTQIGQSWLVAGLGWPGGIVWLAAGLLLLAAGLGYFGVLIPHTWWMGLAGAGAIVSLLALVLYFHPYYVLAVALNLAILYIALRPASSVASFLNV